MPWEWVAPVAAAASTAVVGVAGIRATYAAGKRQQQTALEASRVGIDGQLALAREERQQRRLETAYQELLTRLSEVRQWAASVYPMWTSSPEEYTMPPMAAPPDLARIEAVIAAVWSPRVQQLVRTWNATVDEIVQAGRAITLARQIGEPDLTADVAAWSRSRASQSAATTRLPGLREDLAAAYHAIREQVSRELRAEHDGHAEPETPPELEA